ACGEPRGSAELLDQVDLVIAARVRRGAAALSVAEPGVESRCLEGVGAQGGLTAATAPDLVLGGGQQPGAQAAPAMVGSYPEELEEAAPAPRPPEQPRAQVTCVPARRSPASPRAEMHSSRPSAQPVAAALKALISASSRSRRPSSASLTANTGSSIVGSSPLGPGMSLLGLAGNDAPGPARGMIV